LTTSATLSICEHAVGIGFEKCIAQHRYEDSAFAPLDFYSPATVHACQQLDFLPVQIIEVLGQWSAWVLDVRRAGARSQNKSTGNHQKKPPPLHAGPPSRDSPLKKDHFPHYSTE
jgi:hypothetical protein